MDMYNNGRLMGMAFGLVIGLLLVGVIMIIINKNRRLRTEYDEMQKKVRGEGYCIAFYTVMIIEGILCFLTTAIEIPMEPIVLHFMVIFVGVLVQAGYCIWHDAYVGLNTRLGRYILIMTLVSLFNLFIAFETWLHGHMIVDGVIQSPFINFLCGIMFAILGIVALVKKLTDNDSSEVNG